MYFAKPEDCTIFVIEKCLYFFQYISYILTVTNQREIEMTDNPLQSSNINPWGVPKHFKQHLFIVILMSGLYYDISFIGQ